MSEKNIEIKKIVVLAGGISTEREVSLTSGRMIYEALKKQNYDCILMDVFLGYDGNTDESLFYEDKNWISEVSRISGNNTDIEKIKKLRAEGDRAFFGPGVLKLCAMADMVFLALHGENGENGKVQAAFDLMGIRYTGTDYVSSAIAMDKTLTKELFLQNSIPTPPGFVLRQGQPGAQEPEFPCVVKVTNGGSSVGVYICENQEEYDTAKQEGFRYDSKLIVEKCIKGREFSIGVVEGRALPVIEIAPIEGFYDYKNKYQAGSTIETCPAELDPAVSEAMQRCAENVYQALRLKVYARMDFMLGEDGSFYCLEANTLPGMTPTSLLPQEAAAVGKDFAALCRWIIEASVKKYTA